MKELWIGRVEVLTPPVQWGDTKAFTNVVTWASDALHFKDRVATVFIEYGWLLIGVEECWKASTDENADEELFDAIERAKSNLEACIYTTFHYYPSRPV